MVDSLLLFVSVFGCLVGIGLLAAAVYGIWRYRKRQDPKKKEAEVYPWVLLLVLGTFVLADSVGYLLIALGIVHLW